MPGRDGLGVDFYAKKCVRAKLIAHLRRHFLATLTDGMPDAMKEKVLHFYSRSSARYQSQPLVAARG